MGSLFWILLGPTWVDQVPFWDELGFFWAQCLIGQHGSFNCHVVVVVLITNVPFRYTLSFFRNASEEQERRYISSRHLIKAFKFCGHSHT